MGYGERENLGLILKKRSQSKWKIDHRKRSIFSLREGRSFIDLYSFLRIGAPPKIERAIGRAIDLAIGLAIPPPTHLIVEKSPSKGSFSASCDEQ